MIDYVFDPTIICPSDPTATEERVRQYKDYYKVKFSIVKEYNPKVIVEIGVRAGYSAWAFLSACPNAEYHGFDAENCSHGGQGGPWSWWARKILTERGFNFHLHVPFDTQESDNMPVAANFYHIDGDHTEQGVIHDLDICMRAAFPNAILLVDDYDYVATPEVREGVDKWLSCNETKWVKHIPSLRGEMIICVNT